MNLEVGKLYQFKCDFNSHVVNGTYIYKYPNLGSDQFGILYEDQYVIYIEHIPAGTGWTIVKIIHQDKIGYLFLFQYGIGPFTPEHFFNEVPVP